ncbi:hypothetical protein KKF70_03180 [bacterium]|nr:hypothetical protein [Candidatus Omnitrophota bacterium]MBU2528372.1 hypothetical protein [bacterium]MBU3930630.1 hypothetical protein [bacterium]
MIIKKKIAYSITAFIYMNLLPYISRLPKGIEWAQQYLPDEGHLIAGLWLVHSFYSIPAVLLIISIYTSKKYALPFLLTFLTLTFATVYFNHGYDLSSCSTATIGLVFMPIITSFLGGIAFGLGHAIQYWIIKKTTNVKEEGSDN